MANSPLIQGCLLSSPVIVSELPNLSVWPDSFFFCPSSFSEEPFDLTYSPGKDKRQTVSQVKEEGGGKSQTLMTVGYFVFGL